jgi:hypothetical protein
MAGNRTAESGESCRIDEVLVCIQDRSRNAHIDRASLGAVDTLDTCVNVHCLLFIP